MLCSRLSNTAKKETNFICYIWSKIDIIFLALEFIWTKFSSQIYFTSSLIRSVHCFIRRLLDHLFDLFIHSTMNREVRMQTSVFNLSPFFTSGMRQRSMLVWHLSSAFATFSMISSTERSDLSRNGKSSNWKDKKTRENDKLKTFPAQVSEFNNNFNNWKCRSSKKSGYTAHLSWRSFHFLILNCLNVLRYTKFLNREIPFNRYVQ